MKNSAKNLVVVSKETQKELSKPFKRLSPKETAKATSVKVTKAKPQSNYKDEVLKANSEFKLALRSTGKAIKILLASDVLNKKQIAFLKSIQGDTAKYNKFDASIRRTKANLITPFFVLQALYKATN